MTKAPALNRFQKLVDEISRDYTRARSTQVRFFWETGRRIVEEEQNGAMRAAYGAALIPTLAEALTAQFGPGFSENTLRKTRKFYLQTPIPPTSAELNWSDYVALLPVKDRKIRKQLERRIVKEGLKQKEIRRLVRRVRGPRIKEKTKSYPPLKRPTGLKLHTYQKVTGPAAALYPPGQGRVLLDCGFFVHHAAGRSEVSRGTVTDRPAYTYAAAVERVVDGDTLLVVIDLGFRITVREKLRLRGVNTPELGTPDGERAKRFVTGVLPAACPVILKSRKTDIYGRFVADVFYRKAAKTTAAPTPETILKDGIYFNQQLLDEGLAERA